LDAGGDFLEFIDGHVVAPMCSRRVATSFLGSALART
jgi:hypothetical protein